MARNEHLDRRIRGFTSHAKSPSVLVRVAVEFDHDLEAFQGLLGRRLGADIAGIFVADASAHFTANYLSDNAAVRVGNRVKLIGYDLVPENKRWMEAGVIDVLLTQRPAEQGYRGLHNLCRRMFLDEVCPERIYMPIDIVVRENLAYLSNEEDL